jgi:deoxycytidylate deaminase
VTNLVESAVVGGMSPRDQKKLRVFWQLVASLAGLSTCRRRDVGCVVVDPALRSVLAVGYNGPPARIPNGGCREAEGSCGCVHAEANTLVKLRSEAWGLVMLSTTCPCEHCAGLIVNSGRVEVVIYGDAYRDSRGLSVLAYGLVLAVDVRTLLEELP